MCSIYGSTNEEKHLRPGHYWLCQFGDACDGTSCENEFKLQGRKWEDYKGTRSYDGERAIVIKRWLNHVDEDTLGLTFEEWDPTENVDSSQMPVAMIINSSELRALVSRCGKYFFRSLRLRRAVGLNHAGASHP